jgi:cell division protein FtsA
MELVGIYEQKTAGFCDGAVSDLGELSDCVHATVHTLLQKTNLKLKEVQLGVGSELIEVRGGGTTIPLVDRTNKIITQRDIKKVNDQARLLSLKMDEEILHDLPQQYMVDEVNKALNPGGLYGRKLGVQSLMIFTNANRIRNIVRAVHQAGYEVPNVFFTSYAACEVALDGAERAQGRILIDIGAKATSVLLFQDNILRRLKKIEIGGDAFTRRIAEQLSLPLDLAEEIKRSYAATLEAYHSSDEEILVKRDSAYKPVKGKDICAAIEPQIRELLENVQNVLREFGVADELETGIVMIGGGSLLTGLIERLSQATRHPARLAKMNVASARSPGNAALFAGVVGLAKSGFKQSLRYALSPDGHWRANLLNRFKELYHEYF